MASSPSSGEARAHDVAAVTEEQIDQSRGMTAAEREYVRARANDTARAVEVIEAQLAGWKQSLADAKAAAKQAAADLKAVG